MSYPLSISDEVVNAFPFSVNDGSRLVVAAYTGSRTHGTKIEQDDDLESDEDMIFAFLPSASYILGFGSHGGNGVQDRGEDKKVTAVRGEKKVAYDLKFYTLRHLAYLWVKQNPNVLELLWLPEKYILYADPVFRSFQAIRHEIGSKRIYGSFMGYGKSQIRQMDKAETQHNLGEKRRKMMEEYGIDRKHASHIIRLLRMGIEFLNTGEFNVDRTGIDADELTAIKTGLYTKDQIINRANDLFKEAEVALTESVLPDEPNTSLVEEVLIQATSTHLRNSFRWDDDNDTMKER